MIANLEKQDKKYTKHSSSKKVAGKEIIIRSMGVATPIVRKISSIFWNELKQKDIKDINSVLAVCEHLLGNNNSELRAIAFDWSFRAKKQFKPSHFYIFEKWIQSYVSGWGSCDDFCVHTMGYFLLQFPEFIPQVKKWTDSTDPWRRRAAAVSFIYALRRGEYLSHIFDVADALFNDTDIYVLKGYGWMLKEASNKFQNDVFQYVIKNKATMPRVSLRYAIEKMPNDMRQEAMKK